MRVSCLLILLLVCCLVASAYEGQRHNAVLLNGAWEFAVGVGTEGAETPTGQGTLTWRSVTLPGNFLVWKHRLTHSSSS